LKRRSKQNNIPVKSKEIMANLGGRRNWRLPPAGHSEVTLKQKK
jgi:hypothetical protein